MKRNLEKRYTINDLSKRIHVHEQNERYLHHKVLNALLSLQLRVDTAKHFDPSPLDSDEWKERALLIKKVKATYDNTGDSESAFSLIALAENSIRVLYG